MGSIASIELYVKNTKLFRRRGVMSPFQCRDITNEALPDWYAIIAFTIRHYRTNERKGTSDYNNC
jgi:hypothetical protein